MLSAQTTRPGASFAFPQDHIDDAAEKGQREGHPGQDVGEAIGVLRVEMPFRVPHRVDGGCAHHTQTWGRTDKLGEGEVTARVPLHHSQCTFRRTPGTHTHQVTETFFLREKEGGFRKAGKLCKRTSNSGRICCWIHN